MGYTANSNYKIYCNDRCQVIRWTGNLIDDEGFDLGKRTYYQVVDYSGRFLNQFDSKHREQAIAYAHSYKYYYDHASAARRTSCRNPVTEDDFL